MHSILRQQAAQFVAVGGCGCRIMHTYIIRCKAAECKYARTAPTLIPPLRHITVIDIDDPRCQ